MKVNWNNPLFLITCIIIIISTEIVIQHYALGSLYPTTRTALFLEVLFLFLCVFVFLNISQTETKRIKWINAIFILLMSSSIGVHASVMMDRRVASEWRYDADTLKMLKYLETQKPQGRNLRLGIVWMHEPAINFYIDTKMVSGFDMVTREGVNGEYDFYYVKNEDFIALMKRGKKLIKYYPLSDNYLLK